MDYETIPFEDLLIKLNNLLFYMKKHLDKVRSKDTKVDSQRLRVETIEFGKAAKAFRSRSKKIGGKNVKQS